MGDSDENLLKAINHYQSGLERYMQRQDETKLLHNLGRLYKLPIKVSHLEKTGVGRTVNSLRKLDGEVGDAAKSLVAKWKEMVVQEEDTKTEASSAEDSQEAKPKQVELEEKHNNSHKKDSDRKRSSDKSEKRSSNEKRHKSKSREDNKNDSKENRHREDSNKRSRSESEDSNDDSRNLDSDSSQVSARHIKQKKHSSENRSSKINCQSKEESKHKSKRSKDEGSDDEVQKSKRRNHDRHDSFEEKKHKHKPSHENRAGSSKTVETHSNNTNSKEDNRHDSSKHEKEKKKEHKHKERKEDKHEKRKKSKQDKEEEDSSEKPHSSNGSSSKKHKSSEKSPSSKAPYSAVINGIGSESGTSFADALGMCEPPQSKKKKLSHVEKQTAPSPTYEDKSPEVELPLPMEPLESLDINMSTLLPPITPHYRPLGLPICEQSKKILTDDEALSRVMQNKNQRTKVFSGNKVAWGKVPSLFDICVRILQDNIDALEYTGGVPYSILKPILEKANANQLYMMEHHNPYLIEDSDELWKLHCQKEFRNKSREELETWRDMYMRCLDEREAKLRALTANIKQSQDKSLPVRTTKLAYVDSVAKPPRNVARKQAKNDTSTVRPSPSSKLATLAVKGEAAKVVVPNPGARASDRSASTSSHHSTKVKKAPLMAKTLSLFKNRFKR